jgi:hypothetical protein
MSELQQPGATMGVFIPLDYDISRIKNATEVRVVENLRDRLSDSWHIIPNLDIAKENRPYEIDVLLIHKEYGLIALEVKGGPVEVRKGQWSRRNVPFDVAPPKQAQNAAYALRDELKDSDESLEHIHVAHGLVLPDVVSVSHSDIIDIERKQLFLREDVENFKDRVIDLALMSHRSQPLTDVQATAIIEKVRPDIEFVWDPQSQARNARISLDRIMREQTRALATLDQNQNVYVQGSAGTGKTKLALQWARRALSRDDSTIITCFNIPLGHYIASQFSELDEIYAGYFEDIVAKLPGLPPVPAKPTDPTQLENYYGLTLPRHILKNIDKIEIRFDTVIVDEIQDFHAMWVHVLLALLRSDGPRRFLTVGDEKQNLHGREGVQAVLAFRPTRAELRTNCRNAQRIGELLHSMGGAEVASASPEGEVFVIEANTIEEATEAVITEVQEMLHTEVWDADRILIATIGQNERQALLAASTDALRFTSYEESAEGTITCETVHRAKGLEYDVVVLVAPREDVRYQLMYVGASRAITRLVVIAPAPLFARMGIA